MAPRKVASPAKPRRVTRARAADLSPAATTEDAPKRKATTKAVLPTMSSTKASEAKSRVNKKTPAPAAPKSTTRSSRSTKLAAVAEAIESDNDREEDELTTALAQPSARPSRLSARSATAKSAATTSSLAAAPRRRIKVTPLDSVVAEPAPVSEPAPKVEKKSSSRGKKEAAAATKSTAASRNKRSEGAANIEERREEVADTIMVDAPPKKRGRGRVNTVEVQTLEQASKQTSEDAPKPRGRPRKAKIETQPTKDIAVVSTRQTRTRAGSSVSAAEVAPAVSVVIPRKKVTFQDLPDEDEEEKENLRPAKTGRKPTAASTKKDESSARGMRAKPIRKPAATTTTKSTRGRTAPKEVIETATETAEKIHQRALTPKKITQVAKAVVSDSDESEDELAGSKTPVRDLSLSPKRGINASLVHPLSPVKKLDFTPALNARPLSPERAEGCVAPGILSPPRRNPASPLKESFDQSPRRAPEGVTIFRAHVPDPVHGGQLGLNHSNAQLLQSPKRGLADASIFPASAAKLSKSPLKPSILSSPARRLFSPSKQRTPAHTSSSPTKKASMTPLSEAGSITSPGNVDLVMTSHFRSSVSPQRSARVYRMSDDELAQEAGADLDFDQSILSVRSPLKVDKAKPVLEDAAEEREVNMPAVAHQAVSGVDADGQEDEMQPQNVCPPLALAAEPTSDAAAIGDETIADPELDEEEAASEQDEAGQSDLVSNSASSDDEDDSVVVSRVPSAKSTRISNALFSRLRDTAEDSEDELAEEQTPDNRAFRSSSRPGLNQSNIRSRLSTGIAPPSASRHFAFTPLATQMRGWNASSPLKKIKASEIAAQSRGLFSPVAQMHVEGSVELNRQETPGRSASKRKSLVANRQSLGMSVTGSPANPQFFAEGMAAQDFEDQNEAQEEDVLAEEDLHQLVQEDLEERNLIPTEPDHSPGDSSMDEDDEEHADEPGGLTTDMIKFTNASDTAMVDFQALANEADSLADEHNQEIGSDEAADLLAANDDLEAVEEASHLTTSSEDYADENLAPADDSVTGEIQDSGLHSQPNLEVLEATVLINREEEAEPTNAIEQAESDAHQGEDETFNGSAACTPAIPSTEIALARSVEPIDFNITPVRPDPGLPRYINTVVSKVPLRPEGDVPVSPLKVTRKRARSLSSASSLAAKRRSLGVDRDAFALHAPLLATPKANSQIGSSPHRRIRSSAPSPAQSLFTDVSTPGQMSFAIDDFGDSTLDGIELPEDELMSDDVDDNQGSAATTRMAPQDDTMMTIGSTLFKTPIAPARRHSVARSSARSIDATTPRYAMSTKSSKSRNDATPIPTPSKAATISSRTPATNGRAKTPGTLRKGKTPAKTPVPSRTPLKAVEDRVLTGAVVHVDVHTSEGADASGIFVELLTAMGARCVKEWRWNPRASLAPTSGEQEHASAAETPGSNVGVTHVVYKDGGKRTLEKVRAAKGEVLCVGVGWVLDCEREAKWLDEASYVVDSTILPRGGSRRRKSMEPRMLVNANGLLSAKRDGRRSVSAEYAGLTDAMRLDLINTPVRGREEYLGAGETPEGTPADNEADDSVVIHSLAGDETEISSAYDSPTAATVGGGGETADLRHLMADDEMEGEAEADLEGTPQSTNVRMGVDPSTPLTTSLAVDYDPRTAATPLTPYLIAKGKELVQMSAPPKQVQQGLFTRDGSPSTAASGAAAGGGMRGEMKKFHVKMNGLPAKARDGARRKTLAVSSAASGLAFKPVVASPLRKA